MKKRITLCYQRVRDELSSGMFVLTLEDGASSLLENFAELDYVTMMKKLARHLATFPDAGAGLQRTDRPGLVAMTLPDEEVELFRTDPVAAIQQRCFPPVLVDLGTAVTEAPAKVRHLIDGKPEQAVNVMPPLETGYETRAQAFGELVFLRARNKGEPQAECPRCGRWSKLRELETPSPKIECSSCELWLPVEDLRVDLGWAGVRVYDLLALQAEKYFLPRRWNRNGTWIQYAQLGEMFSQYLKEKEHACTR